MIVADSNLIAYLLIPGEWTEDAEAVLRRDPAWVAPPLWRSEFRNVLALYLRTGTLRLPTALEILDDAERLMDGREMAPDGEQVLRLAHASGCTAYDCEFVQVARTLDLPLVTSDRRLLDRFPEIARSPRDFAG